MRGRGRGNGACDVECTFQKSVNFVFKYMYRMIVLVTHYKIPKSKENYGAMMLFPTRTSIYRRRMYVLHVINTGHRTVVNDTLRVLQRKASTGTGE